MEPEFNYSSVTSIITAAGKSDLPISAIVLRQQAKQMGQTEESIYERIRKSYQVMAECIEPGCNKGLKSISGLADGSAFKMHQISESGKNLAGSFLSSALYQALVASELNAAMGRIAAVPTAGSRGILPTALLTMQEEKWIPERDCVMPLFTASAVGMVITNNTSLVGARGGCQAGCDSAAAMAAAAIVEPTGGTSKMVEHAIAIAIRNILGLVCDPVTGLVKIPCVKHNASGVASAPVAAELALADIENVIPADKVTWTMKKVGGAMSSILKETAEGGLAATPTGRRLHEHVFGTVRETHGEYSGCGGYSS